MTKIKKIILLNEFLPIDIVGEIFYIIDLYDAYIYYEKDINYEYNDEDDKIIIAQCYWAHVDRLEELYNKKKDSIDFLDDYYIEYGESI